MKNRLYSTSDVIMLMACTYIAERGIEHQAQLAARRPQWKAPFFTNLKTRATAILENNIGIDTLALLKQATHTVSTTTEAAHRGLMELKQEIEVDFRKNPARSESLLTHLGLSAVSSAKMTQSTYIKALVTVKNNLTPEVKAELVAAGANPQALDLLVSQAKLLIEANDIQENVKVNRKSINAANVEELNGIYDEVISICKLASTYLVGNKELQDHFSFTNALKACGYIPTKAKKEDDKPSPTK
jgi:hypothetical protein